MNPKLIRAAGLAGSLVFAGVGLLFLFSPDGVLRFMNRLGRAFGLPEEPLAGAGFFLALAVGYMVMVTLFAAGIARFPGDPIYPRLLFQAKAASSLLSFGLFAFHRSSFVFLANGVVDGGLALAALLIVRSIRRNKTRSPA